MSSSNQKLIKFKAGDSFNLKMTVSASQSKEVIALKAQLEIEKQKPTPNLFTISYLDTQISTLSVVDITNWDISSHLRWCSRLISIFEIVPIDLTQGTFYLHSDHTTTSTWIPRVYDCDVSFTKDNKTTSSETFKIEVLKKVTKNDQ